MWFALIFVCGSFIQAECSGAIRICVRDSATESCGQMAADLPENFECVTAPDQLGCLRKVQNDEADVTRVEPRAIYLGGKHLGLLPIATEDIDGAPFYYQAVALVSKNSDDIQSAADLQGHPSCHTGVGRTAGWQIPLGRLMAAGLAKPQNCDDSELDIVHSFFGSACAPGNWSSQPVVHEELRRLHPHLCSRCSDPESCSKNDSYAGYEGALRCLSSGSGDVAFTKTAVLQKFLAEEPDLAEKAEFLCFEGGRKSLDDPEPCIWGNRPTEAFVASSAKSESERNRFVSVLLDTQTKYAIPQVPTPDWYYKSYLSSSKVSALREVGPDRNTYQTYLGDFVHAINKPRPGCESNVAFCVTSEAQASQITHLRLASEARGLWPSVSFIRGSDPEKCVEKVKDGLAKMVVLDGGDIYLAGKKHDLKPIAAEVNNGSGSSYYAVAVIKKNLEGVKKLEDLRGRRSCHTGMGRTAGWVMPVGAMVTAGLLGSGCDRPGAVAEFFSEGSCVPGANDTKYNPQLSGSENLCRRCIGDELGNHVCARTPEERYNRYDGSLRCLSEDAGDVAFVKHSTVFENTDGRGTSPWNKDLVSTDYLLLCPEGGTKDVTDYHHCNLGKSPSHHIMTGSDATQNSRLILAKLTGEMSKYFGQEYSLYKLFGRGPGMVFGKAAVAFKATPLDANYIQVLGDKFLAASKASDPEECSEES